MINYTELSLITVVLIGVTIVHTVAKVTVMSQHVT